MNPADNISRPRDAMYPVSPLGVKEPGVPTGRDVEWEPLIDFRRAGVSETTIHGAIAWAHGDEVFHSFGGNHCIYYCLLNSIGGGLKEGRYFII